MCLFHSSRHIFGKTLRVRFGFHVWQLFSLHPPLKNEQKFSPVRWFVDFSQFCVSNVRGPKIRLRRKKKRKNLFTYLMPRSSQNYQYFSEMSKYCHEKKMNKQRLK